MSKTSDYLDSQGARADNVTAIIRECFDLLEARIAALEPAPSAPVAAPAAVTPAAPAAP